MFDSQYENPNLFKLVSKSTHYDGVFTHEIQHLINLETNEHVKRTLKFKESLSKNQIDNIMDRTKWAKFGKAINYNNVQPPSENIFMEFNPELLRSKKSQNTIQNMLKNPFNNQRVKVYEGREEELTNIITNNYNKLKNNYDKDILNKNMKKIVDYNFKEERKVDSELKTKVNVKTGGYVPPHLRNKDSNTQSNTQSNTRSNTQSNTHHKKYEIKEGENKSIRISNLPSDITEKDIRDWLSKFNYRRLKITLPKDKKTGKSRDFCFVNFESRIEAENSIEKLNKRKFDYCLVTVEFSKY